MTERLLKFMILFDNSSLLYFPGQFLSGRVLIELKEETPVLGLYFHVIGEGVVKVHKSLSNIVRIKKKEKLNQKFRKPEMIDFNSGTMPSVSGLVNSSSPSMSPSTSLMTPIKHTSMNNTISVPKLRRSSKTFKLHHGKNITDKETYIDFRMKLLNNFSDDKLIILSHGVHSFPFKLGLPMGLPSTFIGKHGWVQYYCKTTFREPNDVTHTNQQVFIVMNPIDLNLEPAILAEPYNFDIEHNLGAFCINSGFLLCRISIDRSAYVPGESIEITANIYNKSRIRIKRTKAALIETIQYVSHGKLNYCEKRELSSLNHGKIEPGDSDEWINEHLYVPPLPPTNLRGCHLIEIQYDVYFIIEPGNFEEVVKIQLPIVLATYPFRQTNKKLLNGSQCSYRDNYNYDTSRNLKSNIHYPSTLPIFRPFIDEDKFNTKTII